METEEGEAAGNCEVTTEDVTAVGDTLRYFGGDIDERIILDGSPVVWQGDSRLAGRLITMYLEGEDVERVLVEGDAHLVYFAKDEEESEEDAADEDEINAELDEELGLIETDEVGIDTDIGYSDNIEADEDKVVTETPEDEEGILLTETDENEEGAGTSAGESEDEEETVNGKVEALGDTIDALFVGGDIDEVIVNGDARGIYSPYDEFGALTGEDMDCSGDTITLSFSDGAARKILVEGEAVGVYNPGGTEGRAGLTRSEGDTISVYIHDNEVRRMVVFGGAHGSYFTEEAVAEEEDKAEAGKRSAGPGNDS
jgi:hypothetical protein